MQLLSHDLASLVFLQQMADLPIPADQHLFMLGMSRLAATIWAAFSKPVPGSGVCWCLPASNPPRTAIATAVMLQMLQIFEQDKGGLQACRSDNAGGSHAPIVDHMIGIARLTLRSLSKIQ
jgi:hypothetical protein